MKNSVASEVFHVPVLPSGSWYPTRWHLQDVTCGDDCDGYSLMESSQGAHRDGGPKWQGYRMNLCYAFSPLTTFLPSVWKVNWTILNWDISTLCFSPEDQKYPWKMLTNWKHLSFLLLFPWWQKKKKIIFPTKTKPAAHSLGQFIPIFAFALASMVQSSTMVAKACKMCLPLVYEVGAHLPLLPPVQDSSWWDKCLYRPHPIQKVILMFVVMLGKQHCSLWWWDTFSVVFFSDFFFFFVLTSWIFTAPGHQRSPSKGSALCCRYAKQNPGFLLNFSHTGWWD